MRLKLSLTAKGLMLVLVPLCFEIGFVWALVSLQQATEVEAESALKSRELSDRLNICTRNLYRLWNVVDEGHEYGETNTTARFFAIYKSNYLPVFHTLTRDYATLNELTKDNPELNFEVRKSLTSLNEIETTLDKAFADIRDRKIDNVIERYHQVSSRLVRSFQDLASQSFAILAKHEREAAELSAQRQTLTRQSMIVFVVVACALNAVFCLLLALFLLKDITSRLAVLSDNARRVGANESLNPLIAGDDEIAELDRVFHGMADAIEETARLRQEFVSMLTHDLRSPLTAIQATLELLASQAEKNKDDRGKDLLKVAERNSSRMIDLIGDLLDIQKIKAGMMTISPTQVCVAEVFEEVGLSVAGWIEDSNIKLKIDDTALFVHADRQKLERVVFNLVANAIKFSPAGSTITLSAAEHNGMVQLSVADQGKGIPIEEQKSIFERFRQVQSKDKNLLGGSGLGLTICQYIVAIHKGEIWVKSAPGEGSTFYLTLPPA